MNRPSLNAASLARVNVRAASLLVPRRNRATWSAEWLAEIHHLCHESLSRDYEDAFDDPSGIDPVSFSLGAFSDAFWIRCDLLRSAKLPAFESGSAARCLLILASAALTALVVGLALPGARNALLPVPYRNSANLVVLSSHGYAGTESPSIRLSDYEEWTSDTHALFGQIAFYRPTMKGVHLADEPAARLAVAQASANLLQVLGISLPQDKWSARGPSLFLSRSAWHRFYRGDPGIVGRTADIDGRPVLIAAILPNDDCRLPGKIDAILLEDAQALSALPSATRGFVMARIRDSAFPPPRGGWRTMVDTRDGTPRYFQCMTLRRLVGQPFIIFLFALLMASLALPATTSLPLGDYPHQHGRLPAMLHARRWLLLIAKSVLVIIVVGLYSIDLAYGLVAGNPITALYIQLATSFPALLFGFRWILQDQRRRCPECLRLLSNPARVGQASCNFLSWNGMELFCSRGHGLLHIPELPTSWFSTQRWLCLDSSWLCLFADNYPASAEMI